MSPTTYYAFYVQPLYPAGSLNLSGTCALFVKKSDNLSVVRFYATQIGLSQQLNFQIL